MTCGFDRKKQKPFRRLIFRVDSYVTSTTFLLAMFFFLIAGKHDINNKPGIINLPASNTYNWEFLEFPVAVICITKDGKIFYDLDEKDKRIKLLQKMSAFYDIHFNANETSAFTQGNWFGNDIRNFYLGDKNYQHHHKGIPVGQLYAWIKSTKQVQSRCHFGLRADKDLPFATINSVLKQFQANHIKHIFFITKAVKNKS